MTKTQQPADPAARPTLSEAATAAPGAVPFVRRPAHDPIAEGLRRLWAAAEEEPVPDDFLSILDRADDAEARRRASGGDRTAGDAP